MAETNCTVELRPYQQRAIQETRRALAEGHKRVCLYAPTGAGKTELAIGISQLARAKNRRVMFLANRVELISQAAERFARYGIYPGILQGENTHNTRADIVVGSIQTFSSRKRFGWNFDTDILIVDEAHGCAGSQQYLKLFETWNNIPVIGLTATPFSRGLGKKYPWGTVFEKLVVVSTIRELIDMDYLVDCEIYAPSEPDLSGVKIVAGDYHEGQLGEAVDKQELIGDIVSHWKKLSNGVPTICFATNIAHSKHIVEQFLGAGISAEHVDCYMADEDRKGAIARFKRGETRVLSNVALFAEGFDAPATACMILARPTKSLIRYIQMAGRVLRPADGKDKALILDHSGTVRRLGFPTDDLPLELDDGKPKKAGESKPKERLPKVCTSCGYVDPKNRHKCPSCGFAPERKSAVETREGELVQFKKSASKNDKQAIYSALVGYFEAQKAKGRNWKEGWVANKYRDITGVWPQSLSWTVGPMVPEVDKRLTHERIRWKNRKPVVCPKCGSGDYSKQPGKGPHEAGAKCNQCGAFWWLKKAA